MRLQYGAGQVAAHTTLADGTLGPAACKVKHGPGATPATGRQDKARKYKQGGDLLVKYYRYASALTDWL